MFQVYGGEKKVLQNQVNLLKREDDLTVVFPSQIDVALAVNVAGINAADKMMLMKTGMYHCFNGENNSKQRLILWDYFVFY